MATHDQTSPGEGTYVLGDSGTEMARLIEQDHHFTRAMGGLLPEIPDLSAIHRVLDVACGPGGWALELAQLHPHIQIVGFDISAHMINYANAQANASGLDNAHFEVMDVTQPLDFDDNSFDLVNARFLGGFMPVAAWPKAIAEFMRITRPGGVIRLTESEWRGTTSAAYEQSFSLTVQAAQRIGQIFSPDGRYAGLTPIVSRFLRDADCLHIKEVAHAINFSAGTPSHRSVTGDFLIAAKLFQPFQVGMGVATQQEVDQLEQQMPAEMLSDEFYGILFLLTALGEKPSTAVPVDAQQ